jgi:hypothetical protein
MKGHNAFRSGPKLIRLGRVLLLMQAWHHFLFGTISYLGRERTFGEMVW